MGATADIDRDRDVKELIDRLKRFVSPEGAGLVKRVEDKVNAISTELVGFKAMTNSPAFRLPIEERLTATQSRLFALLSKAGERGMTSDGLYQGLYSALPESDQPNDPETVIKVHVSNIRKRIAGSEFKIETIWGRGFRLVNVGAVSGKRPEQCPASQ